jgi:hypothetical protein
LQEKQIRRLKSQVKTVRGRMLKGRPRGFLDGEDPSLANIDREYFEEYDDTETAAALYPPRRLCEEVALRKSGGRVMDISKEKLLEASLMSLEAMARQKHTSRTGSGMGTGMLSGAGAGMGGVSRSHYDELRGGGISSSHYLDGAGATGTSLGFGSGMGPLVDVNGTLLTEEDAARVARHPTEAYLRGAVWLGRNMAMVIEELADLIDAYRSKFIVEVAGTYNK